jgi:hypothetical protein
MQGTQSPLRQHFPLVYAEHKNKGSSDQRLSTLESLTKELVSTHYQFYLGFNFQGATAEEIAQNAYTELTHQVDAYNSKNKTKQYVSAMIAVACVVSIVANTVLGVAALGVALIITNHFPCEQQLNAEKIKATLNVCEALLHKHHATDLKEKFKAMHSSFAVVSESFYSTLNRVNFTYGNIAGDDSLKRLEFLQAVVKQLDNQGKLVNSEAKIYAASLTLIEGQFADYVQANNKAECLQKAKEYIARVTQDHLVNNMLPMKTEAA